MYISISLDEHYSTVVVRRGATAQLKHMLEISIVIPSSVVYVNRRLYSPLIPDALVLLSLYK